MRLLLDTSTFLWWIEGGEPLSPPARAALSDPANDVFLSAVSAWEIGVKHALGRLPLPEPPARYVPAQRKARRIEPLPLDEAAALHLTLLPRLHRDPFDRMLICQAIVGGLTLVTPDPEIARYPVPTLWF
ncbi:MAG: type II toxin-antitoxin system VapC family toxin [Myxococcales bacterium]|nr:type II toxin-antitoxin system VapC family toxin [Myxococcales bacterium]